jgi:nicotinamide mononucleotide transporter
MIETWLAWLLVNWVEVTGSVLGIAYIFFSIQQKLVTWLLGLLTSVLYIYVFFVSKFYADMALQVYYVWISIYGWVLWAKGVDTSKGHIDIRVSKLKRSMFLKLGIISALLFIGIYFVLKYFTDSPVAVGDSFTTALSIVATWMLARKIIEHWIVWVVVDGVSVALYLYKDLYATSILFIVYTIAAIWGYYIWSKDIKPREVQA